MKRVIKLACLLTALLAIPVHAAEPPPEATVAETSPPAAVDQSLLLAELLPPAEEPAPTAEVLPPLRWRKASSFSFKTFLRLRISAACASESNCWETKNPQTCWAVRWAFVGSAMAGAPLSFKSRNRSHGDIRLMHDATDVFFLAG